LGKELKRMPNKYGHNYSGFFLPPSVSSSPTSVFSFFPILIVEKMCATLCNNVGLSFGGIFRIPQGERRSRDFPQEDVRDFQMIVLPFGVWVLGVAPKRVRKIN